MTEPNGFQQTAEAEVQRSRCSGNLAILWKLVKSLPPEHRIAYRLVLAPFGYPDEVKDRHSDTGTPEQLRIGACRLALLAMYFDSGVPRWSSWMLAGVINGLQAVPQGSARDLLKSMWQMLSESNLPLTRELAQFIKDTIRNLLSRRSFKLEIDLDWLLPWPEAMTPTQAYFVFHSLALKPYLFTKEIEQKISTSLKGTDYYNEVFPDI